MGCFGLNKDYPTYLQPLVYSSNFWRPERSSTWLRNLYQTGCLCYYSLFPRSPVFLSLWILFFKSYFLVLPFRDSDIIGKETLCPLCSLYFLSKEQVGLLLLPLILENALVTFFWSISDNQVKDRWLSLYIEWFISYSGHVNNKLPWDGKNSLFFLSPSTIIDA